MNKPPSQWQQMPDQPPRCLTCAYVLTGLHDNRCPECGRDFDLDNPKSFTTKPPFLAWKFWLPGFALGWCGAMIGAVIILAIGNWGAALWFAVPFAGGSLLGYRFRSRWWLLGMLVVGLSVSLCLGMMMLDLAGIFCGMVLAVVFLGPVFLGTLMGAGLRQVLKQTPFSQRWHLPALALMLFPVACGLIEGRPPRHVPERVSTSMVMDAPAEACWDAIMFYEDVTHEPPWILKVGLARPLHTKGRSSAPGDVKVCVYNKGWITKKVVKVEPHRRLSFEVIDQNIGYERDVALRGGSFAFEAMSADRTRVTLTTEYEPLLTPRWAWRWSEVIAVHTLHNHVLEGMRLSAQDRKPPQTLAAGGPHAN